MKIFGRETALWPDEARGLFLGEPGGDLLSHTRCALSSAQLRFTVLFGMGRGGSKVLWPPSVTCITACGETRRAKWEEGLGESVFGCD